MTNAEKYKDFIMKCNDVCKEFIEPIVLKHFGCLCGIENGGIDCVKCELLSKIFLIQDYHEPEVDWSQVPVDTPVFVRDYDSDDWVPSHFAKYENKKVYVWLLGGTSFTSENDEVGTWEFAKLAEDSVK